MIEVDITNMARAAARHLEERNLLAGSIIAMSRKTGESLAKVLAPELVADGGAEVGELAGVPVVFKDEDIDPVLITADGKVYSLLPEWARKGQAGKDRSVILLPT
jgi:Asp-tRNA(Asn)/Glu-tRNA(Gln) amidotransferase A subunit family amidase